MILTSANLYQFSFGFHLLVPFTDQRAGTDTPISDPDETWKVIVVKPDGTSLEKEDDLIFPDETVAAIAFPVAELDLNQKGEYSCQIMRTTDGAGVLSDVRTFTVIASLPLEL